MNMPFGIADEVQLASLTRILDDHCTAFRISNDRDAREHVGRLIMALFNCRYSTEQIEHGAPSGIRKRRHRAADYIRTAETVPTFRSASELRNCDQAVDHPTWPPGVRRRLSLF